MTGRSKPGDACTGIATAATAQTCFSGEVGISLGCDGLRMFSGIAPDKMMRGLRNGSANASTH
jgi:uncharacterized protein (DUF169 family)